MIVVAALALAGCGREAQEPAETSASATSSPSSTSTPAPTSGTAGDQQYKVTMTEIRGESYDGAGSWKSEFGILEGGDPAVVEAFNEASRTAVLDQID